MSISGLVSIGVLTSFEHLLFEISNNKRVLLIEMMKFSSSRSKLVLLDSRITWLEGTHLTY